MVNDPNRHSKRSNLAFKVSCMLIVAALVCEQFPQTQRFTLILGIAAFGILMGDVLASIMVEAAPRIDYAAGAEYQLAQRVLRDYDQTGPHGETVILARAYMAMVEAANGQ